MSDVQRSIERVAATAPADLCDNGAFCRAAFENLHIGIGGETKPCCEFEGKVGDVVDSSIADLWHGAAFGDLRAKMLGGARVDGCRKCYEAEDAGGESLRTMFNGRGAVIADRATAIGDLTPALPRTLDLRFSNVCNLSCRTCGPHASTKWFPEAKELAWRDESATALVQTFTTRAAALEALGPTLETVEEIYFAGGEPMLQSQHYMVLQELIARGRTDVRLVYNSNMTELRLGRLEILPLWAKFKSVLVLASIDGHGKLGELVREGLSWERFAQNIATVRAQCPAVKMKFAITVSVLNVLALPDLCRALTTVDPRAAATFDFNVLLEPRIYSIQVLPPGLKAEAKRRIERFADEFGLREQVRPIVNYMMFADRSSERAELRAMTRRLDAMRGRDTAATIPELAPLLAEPVAEKYARLIKQGVQWLKDRSAGRAAV